jgi:[citrate (pro-3S)-lyase] ligase
MRATLFCKGGFMIDSSLIFKEGQPFKGLLLKKLKNFLTSMNLDYTDSIDYTVMYIIEDEIVATGSLSSNILVDFAIRDDLQGESLSVKLITALLYKANEREFKTLYIFTKPHNIKYFLPSNFYELVRTDDVALLSNNKNIISEFTDIIKNELGDCAQKTIGSIVVKADPFTLGHKYLVETAVQNCDILLVFVVEKGNTYYDFETRFKLVVRGVKEYPNVHVFRTSLFMVSPLTFPSYFYKGKTERQKAISNIDLDLKIFSYFIAKNLNISKRFIGTEPYSEVTNLYNERMKELLPKEGIQVIEIMRVMNGDEYISATKVRRCFEEGNLDEIKAIVPSTTYKELCKIIKKREINDI